MGQEVTYIRASYVDGGFSYIKKAAKNEEWTVLLTC